MKKLTLIKVAELAGVGIATVDRVLNERGGVRPETVRKVLRAARQAGLQRLLPDDTQHPWQIEVFLSSNGTWFFQQLADEFANIADRLGYRKIKLFRTLVSENPPEKLAEKIKKAVSCATVLLFMGMTILLFMKPYPGVKIKVSRWFRWFQTYPIHIDSAMLE